NSTMGYRLRWPKKNLTHCPGWVDHYTSINSTVTVQPGAINITAHGVSEEKLVGELEGRVQGIFRHEMQSLLSSTKLEYSQKE
ncbi:hypothetical protein, partial [Stutzerimonas stutzeri]|uniref:hypothetical protein n=1 Tax=Stutzerimonas stutzeri TaxID=316 RepID=UPI001C8BDF1B